MSIYAAPEASSSSFLTYLLIGALIFSFGYARAVWVRARKDYKATKAAVKPLRKAMWSSIGKALRLGVFVVLAGVALFAWVVSDVRDDKEPTPAGVTTPSPTRSR